MKRATKKIRFPVKYPSVPDRGSRPTRYNEPDLRIKADRVPTDRFQVSNTRADLRIRVEELLQHKEAIPEKALTALGADARSLLAYMLEDETVRSQESTLHRLIGVVGQLSLKRGIAPLSAILTDRSTSSITKAYAANALGRIGDASAIEALGASVGAKDDMVRRQVAIALGRIDREAVIPHLLRLREDKSIAVAEIVAESIGLWEGKLGQQMGAKRKASQPKSRRTTRQVRKRSPNSER
jgi:HEAT repeat protein